MVTTIKGGMIVNNTVRFGILVSRFNEFVTKELLSGCLETLDRYGVSAEAITVIWCPGSFEIPVVAKAAAKSGKFDVLICLGAVIRGATSHYDLVAGETASGIAAVGKETGIPAVFGVVTTDTIEQAIERSGSKAGNKGSDAAITAIEIVDLLRKIGSGEPN